jgi:hypothetical protein
VADLTSLEKRQLERLFQMSSGYVLNFSNRTWQEFVKDCVGRDIYDASYAVGSGSKANLLRGFWKEEGNLIVGRLLAALLDYAQSECGVAADHADMLACRRTVARLSTMALKFPGRWRVQPPEDREGCYYRTVPALAVEQFIDLIKKVAGQGHKKRVFECFKQHFSAVTDHGYGPSTTTDYSLFDMTARANGAAAANAPLFVEAFYSACAAILEWRLENDEQIWAPDADMVNGILAANLIGYTVDPPHLTLEEPAVVQRRRQGRATTDEYRYSVALSFAGEQRPYVDEVAGHLRDAGASVFYDMYEQVRLWGENLVDKFDVIYGPESRYVVMFISDAYAKKAWPKVERQRAQADAFATNRIKVLPVRFDDTEVPGVLSTVAYIDLKGMTPRQLANAILKKLRDEG